MSDDIVCLDEENSNNLGSNSRVGPAAPRGMIAWLIRNKVVKNTRQGEYVLLGVVILLVISAIGIFVVSIGGNSPSRSTAEQLQQIQAMKVRLNISGTRP